MLREAALFLAWSYALASWGTVPVVELAEFFDVPRIVDPSSSLKLIMSRSTKIQLRCPRPPTPLRSKFVTKLLRITELC